MTSPVRSRTSGSWPAARSSSQRSAVRRSCQTSARWIGSPVAGSQATTVSRWLVIPIASSSAPWMPASTIASHGDAAGHVPDFAGVVLDPARPREVLLELRVGAAGDPPLRVEDEAGRPGRPLVDREDQGVDSAHDRQQALGDPGGVVAAGAEPAQPHPVHQRHDRARVALGLGHLERLQRRRGDPFVGLEAAQRGLVQGRVARRLQVQLDLGQLLDPVARLLDHPFDFGRDLLDARVAAAQLRGDLLLARHLLADEEQQALAQQVHLAGEVVGERAERDPGGAGDAAVGDGGDSLAADQLDRGTEDSLAGVGGRDGGQEAPAYPLRPIVRSNEQGTAREAPSETATMATTDDRPHPPACRSRRSCSRPERRHRGSWSRRRWSAPRRARRP